MDSEGEDNAESIGQADPVVARRVEALAGFGIADRDIARVVGIAAADLHSGYRDELETGQIKANSRVAQNLYRKATGDGREAVTAAIFWLKARARWRDGTPQAPEPAIEVERTPRQLAMAVLAILRGAHAGEPTI